MRPVVAIIAIALLSAAASTLAQTAALLGPYQRYEDARSRGDFVAAADYARQSLEATEQQYGDGSAEYAAALERLGDAYAEAGSLDQAAYHLALALQAKERLLGVDHPDLIDLLESLVAVEQRKPDFFLAASRLQRVIDIEKGVYGENHAQTIATMQQLETLYIAAGEQEAAAAMATAIQQASEITKSFDPMSDDEEQGFAMVKVFYGTNRSRTGKDRATRFYGIRRGDLELGYVEVSIPQTHKYGQLESESIFSILVGDETRKKRYVLLQSVEPLEGEDFFDALRDNIEKAKTNDVFLFVHGFNVTFADAARRAAQLSYDLDFDGTAMMYSWPSQASTAAYTVDEAVVRPSGRKLAQLLDGVVAETDAERIHLIAHSMGNRALIEALQAYVANHGKEASNNTFDQVVFTAPDVDRDYFIDVMDAIGGVAQRTTLYASENDMALKTSRILHGAPRAGLAGNAIVMLPGLDTIDMSGVEAGILGHSYFAANEGAIYDLFRLFWLGDPPGSRCGMNEQQLSGRGFWMFEVDDCRGEELLQAGVLFKRFGGDARDRILRRITQLTDPDEEPEKEEWSRILDKLNLLINPVL